MSETELITGAELSPGKIYFCSRVWGEYQYFSFSNGYNHRLILHQEKNDPKNEHTIGFRMEDDKYVGWSLTLSKNVSKWLDFRPVKNNKELAPVLSIKENEVVINGQLSIQNGNVNGKETIETVITNTVQTVGAPHVNILSHFPLRRKISVLGADYQYYNSKSIGSPFSPFLVIQPSALDALILVTTNGKDFLTFQANELFNIEKQHMYYLSGWYDTEQNKHFLLETYSAPHLISTSDFISFQTEDTANFAQFAATEIYSSFYQSQVVGGRILLGTQFGAYISAYDGNGFTKLQMGHCRVTGYCSFPTIFITNYPLRNGLRDYVPDFYTTDHQIFMSIGNGANIYQKKYPYPHGEQWTGSLSYKRFWVTPDDNLYAYGMDQDSVRGWFGPVYQSEYNDTGSMGFTGVSSPFILNPLDGFNNFGCFRNQAMVYNPQYCAYKKWEHGYSAYTFYAKNYNMFPGMPMYFPDMWETNSLGVGFSPYDKYIYY